MKKQLPILIAIILILIPTAALAKGAFTYLTIKGPGINEDLSVTNPTMLDFFAFANFSKGAIPMPSNPGAGYEIVRSSVDENKKVQNFDMLHYYPDTGYVYYDGLLNGSSEYDKQWYVADPNVESKFRAVLAEQARLAWFPLIALAVLLIVFGVAYFRKK